MKPANLTLALEIRAKMLRARELGRSYYDRANKAKGAEQRNLRESEMKWRGKEEAFEDALCMMGYEPMTATKWVNPYE